MTELREFTSPTKEKPQNESVASMQQMFPACFATLYAAVTILARTSLALMERYLGGTESGHKKMVWIPGGPKGELQISKTVMLKQESEDEVINLKTL